MTDQEIEKALGQCGNLVDFECEGCPLQGESVCYSILWENAFAYINRLKAENERIFDTFRAVTEKEKAQIRKETAKEVFGWLCGNAQCAEHYDLIKFGAEYFGVEVDE